MREDAEVHISFEKCNKVGNGYVTFLDFVLIHLQIRVYFSFNGTRKIDIKCLIMNVFK